MSSQSAPSAEGLEGIVVTQTRLSKVEGDIGKLTYAGYNIMDLAEHAQFEEVVYLLWNLKLPNQSELDAFKADIRATQGITHVILEAMKHFPAESHPMAVLRSAVSMMALFDKNSEDNSIEANKAKALNLVATMPTIVAAWERIRSGNEPIAPHDSLDLAANFLYMMTGKEPTEAEVDAIDAYLVLLADHGLNASTFSSRVTTSTLADIYSAITTAIGTLKGAAHGGANQRAMEQFIDIGSVDNVDQWYADAQTTKRRIMGIGHRVYKAEDPRGTILRARAQALADAGVESKWFDIAYALDQKARSDEYYIERNLYANVDYYSAIVLRSVGIPVDQFTCLFAMSRAAGWCAHVIEQWENNRLIRPRAEYVGEMDLPWVPLEERE
ncbi:MAG: citrate/2-methylcitrate synthase [Anaerolineae bacterium]